MTAKEDLSAGGLLDQSSVQHGVSERLADIHSAELVGSGPLHHSTGQGGEGVRMDLHDFDREVFTKKLWKRRQACRPEMRVMQSR
jgi:hypothetical protein